MAGTRGIVLLWAVGCATTSASTVGDTRPTTAAARTPLKIVDAAFAKETSRRSEPLVVPFGVNQDGTELLLVAIDRAKQQGAAYLGDVQTIVTFRWSGRTVECRTRVVLDGDPALAAAAPEPEQPAGAYSTKIEEYRPRKLSVTARETALRCEEGTSSKVVQRKATVDERINVENSRAQARAGGSSPLDYEVQTERVDRCKRERVERHTERYDYELKLGFIPPDLAYISRRYGDRALRTTAPLCYQVAQPTEPLYRLTATAFYRGDVMTRPKTRLPSDLVIESMEVAETVALEGQQQRCHMMGGGKAAAGGRPRPNGGETCEDKSYSARESGWFERANQWKEKEGPWRGPEE